MIERDDGAGGFGREHDGFGDGLLASVDLRDFLATQPEDGHGGDTRRDAGARDRTRETRPARRGGNLG